jgi:hypothetical protein
MLLKIRCHIVKGFGSLIAAGIKHFSDIFQLGNFASKILCAAKTAHFAVIYSSKILTSVVIFSKGVYPCQQKRFGTDLQKKKTANFNDWLPSYSLQYVPYVEQKLV